MKLIKKIAVILIILTDVILMVATYPYIWFRPFIMTVPPLVSGCLIAQLIKPEG